MPVHQLAEPGDVRKEFEKQQELLQKQEEERKAKEDAASAAILAEIEKEQVYNYSLIVITSRELILHFPYLKILGCRRAGPSCRT